MLMIFIGLCVCVFFFWIALSDGYEKGSGIIITLGLLLFILFILLGSGINGKKIKEEISYENIVLINNNYISSKGEIITEKDRRLTLDNYIPLLSKEDINPNKKIILKIIEEKKIYSLDF